MLLFSPFYTRHSRRGSVARSVSPPQRGAACPRTRVGWWGAQAGALAMGKKVSAHHHHLHLRLRLRLHKGR